MEALRRHGALLAVLLLALLWFAFLRPANMGGTFSYVMIRGTSMLPTYRAGDLIVLRSQPNYGIGEIVAYRVPAPDIAAGKVVIHRIVGGAAAGGFTMRGDNNHSIDPWHPRAADIVGTPLVRLTGVGVPLARLRQPILLAGLAAAFVVMLTVSRQDAGRPFGGRRLRGGSRGLARG